MRIAPVLARAFSISPPKGLDDTTAGRLRAAQIGVIARYTSLLLAVNLINGLVLVLSLDIASEPPSTFLWFACLLIFCISLARRLYRRRRRSPSVTIGKKALSRAILNAAELGAIWGMAAILFFNRDVQMQIGIICVIVGMMSGGVLALASLPQAVIAYATPLALGSFIALLRGADKVGEYFIAPMVLSYAIAMVLAALSLGKQFVNRTLAQINAETRAHHDPLTGLPNRVVFENALEAACRRLDHYGERFALFYIDLDDFKIVNDSYGHQAGDQLLKQMAGRFSLCLRETDVLARIGGDEFVMIARGLGTEVDAAALVDRLMQAIAAPFALESGSIECSVSIGAALAPANGTSPPELVAHADAALYEAKHERDGARHARDGGFHLHAPSDNRDMSDRRALARDMKGALARNEFFLQFQPIQELASGRIALNEALVRWRHPGRGLVAPMQFIAIAERLGLIHELGEWIMFEACREAALWPSDVNVAVNVSPQQICDDAIVTIVDSALRAAGLCPSRLHVEVTESAVLASAGGTLAAIEQLHERGVSIVLDDFGTGFSSFDHIRRLPARGLKIDRSFVSSLPERKNHAIIQAVAYLGGSLGLDVTAEGIETATQFDYVKAAGCTHGQGYLISRPQDASVVRAMLTAADAA
ncbi:MAG: putative bifunctional diguanylate cyclase/phosphodiesterase [Rhodoblastus sp.]